MHVFTKHLHCCQIHLGTKYTLMHQQITIKIKMHILIVQITIISVFKIPFLLKLMVANKTNEWFNISMNCFKMCIQIYFLTKWFVANQTIYWVLIIMNSFNMCIQIWFWSKWFVANQTREWFLVFMNSFDMWIKIWFLSKCLATN